MAEEMWGTEKDHDEDYCCDWCADYELAPAIKSDARPALNPEPVVDEARRLVYGDRGAVYGHPALDYARTAKLFSAILGTEVTTLQAIQCMIAVKLSRLVNTPEHRDSWVDIAGYAECGWRTVRYENGELDS